MALIEKYHVVAAMQKVDPSSNDIKEGMLVALNGASGVRRVVVGDVNKVYGIAGDTFSQTAAAMPGIDSTAIVGNGKTASWQGRVSDAFDETRASGKITVYHGGGEFATDMYVDSNVAAANIGQIMVADQTGVLTNAGTYANVAAVISANKQPVAMLLSAAGAYASGVPGIDVLPNNDVALKGANSSRYIEIKLLV